MSASPPATARERDEILRALASGHVPRLGLRHIQVGRTAEVQALVKDIDQIAAGGAALRLVVGEPGAGKTFVLNLIRLAALERGCVTIHADLAPDRRLHGAGGQARGLYAQAVCNMATRTRPEGGALAGVVERFITACVGQGEAHGTEVGRVIDERLSALRAQGEVPEVDDHAEVLKAYWRGSEEGDDALKSAALRWLGGAYSVLTEARQALGVGTIIDDAGVYGAIRWLAAFVRLAGYGGLLVVFDETAGLSRPEDPRAPGRNDGQVLRMLDEVRRGHEADGGPGLSFVFGATSEVPSDPRRGLAGIPALRAAPSENAFPAVGAADGAAPVLRLEHLAAGDLLTLLANIRAVFAPGAAGKRLVPDAALQAFMEHCSRHLGPTWFRTPRAAIGAFVQWLGALEHAPGTRWQDVLSDLPVAADSETLAEEFERGEPAPDVRAAAGLAHGEAHGEAGKTAPLRL